jgi:hypothetical protein
METSGGRQAAPLLPFSRFLCKEKLHPAREVSTISGLELKLPG